MTITLPAYLEEFKYMVGFEFPQADEDALRRCAQAWRAAAVGLRSATTHAQQVAPMVDSALGGDTGPAFDRAWQPVAQVGSGYLDQLGRACDQMADACEHAATEVEYAKYEFIGALVFLAATVAYLLGLAIFGGVSAAGVPVAVAATQMTIRTLLVRLVASIAVAEAFTVGFDALAQFAQVLQGHRARWDWGKTTRSVEAGVVYGTVFAAGFGLAARVAPEFLSGLRGAGVASVSALTGTETDALLHGELPTGKDFLLSLTASLTMGAVAGTHPSGHGPSGGEAAASVDVAEFDRSTVDSLARLSEVDVAVDGTTRLAGDVARPSTLDRLVDGQPVGDDHPPTTTHDVPPTPHDESAQPVAGPLSPLGLADRPDTTAPAPPEEAPSSAPMSGGPASPPDAVPTGGAGPAAVTAGPAPGRPADVSPVRAGGPDTRPPVPADARSDSHPHDPAVVGSDSLPHDPAALPGTGHDPATPAAPAVGAPGHLSIVDAPTGAMEPVAAVDDVEARNLLYDSLFATDAGWAFYSADDPIREFARTVEPTEGYLTLDLHGAADGFYIDDHRITVEQFARNLRDLYADGVLDLPEGTRIKLISCETASGGETSPAAQLARALAVEVVAPDRTVWTSMEGVELVSSPASFGGFIIPKYPPDGAWHRFDAFGDEVPLDFDPGYHGPPVDGSRPLSQFTEAYGGYDAEPYDNDAYTANAYDEYDPNEWPD